jgi:hypothetical protein
MVGCVQRTGRALFRLRSLQAVHCGAGRRAATGALSGPLRVGPRAGPSRHSPVATQDDPRGPFRFAVAATVAARFTPGREVVREVRPW